MSPKALDYLNKTLGGMTDFTQGCDFMDLKTIVGLLLVAFVVGGAIWLHIKHKK
jgi:hypothetical protein